MIVYLPDESQNRACISSLVLDEPGETLKKTAAPWNPARAEVTYNYADHFLFDSATGYYWQALEVPTETLIPSRGTIAAFTQITTLAADAGIPSLHPNGTGVPAPYDPTLANFIDSSHAPACQWLAPVGQLDLSLGPIRVGPAAL